MKKWMFAVFGLILFSGVFAAENASANVLNLKYNIMACRMGAINSLVAYGENTTNLTSNGLGGKLGTDMAMLQAFAMNGDRKEFNNLMKTAVKGDMKDTVLYLKDVKKTVVRGHIVQNGSTGGNQTTSHKPVPVTDYFKQTVQDRNLCVQHAVLAFAKGEENEIGARLRDMNDTVVKLRNKSVNTTKMEAIMQSAWENLQAFQGISNGDNSNDTEVKVKELREQHLHLWARFHIEKIRAILNVVQSQAVEKGYQSEVDSINALLSDAESKVIVGVPYDPGQFELVKGDLVDATAKLRDLIQKVGGV